MAKKDKYDCGICTKTRASYEASNISGYRPCDKCILPRLLDALERLVKG